MCTRYPIINRVSELKVHIELTRFVQPEKIEIDANERAVNEKSQYCFFVCTTFDSFLNDCFLHSITFYLKTLFIDCQRAAFRLPFLLTYTRFLLTQFLPHMPLYYSPVLVKKYRNLSSVP